MNNNIIWKDVPGFPMYEVSNTGVVRSWLCKGPTDKTKRRKKPTIIKHNIHYNGYHSVRLYKNSKCHSVLLHRIVLLAFMGKPPNNYETRHLDGNVNNNNLSNLCWGTKKENYQDSVRHGTKGFGENSARAVLTNSQVKEILFLLRENKIKQYVIGKMYGVDSNAIGLIKRNVSYKNVLPEIREEIKRKISIGNTSCSKETRRKLSLAHKGRKFSEEHKNKISKALLAFHKKNEE